MPPEKVSLLAMIEEAFASRSIPQSVVKPAHPSTDEYEDALAFEGKSWKELTCADLTQYWAAPFGFSPEAFCYFLPGIYSAGIREDRPDLLVNVSLIGCLDRSNTPSSWDGFFLERWPNLTPKECEATQKWILWIADFNPPPVEDISLSRAFDTLNILANQKGAIPLGAWPRDR